MRGITSGRIRVILAAGALAAVGALATAAAFTDSADVHVALDGSQNTFDIVVAGGVGVDPSTWTPDASTWAQGNPDAVRLGIGESGEVISPGGAVDAVIAVKNASPRLGATIALTISDPLPQGEAVDPTTGNYLELYDQLVFTVTEVGGPVLIDHVPAAQLGSYVLPGIFAPDDHAEFAVKIELPESVDNRWQLAATDVLFSFQAAQS